MASTSADIQISESEPKKYQNVINVIRVISRIFAGCSIGAAVVGIPGLLIITHQKAKYAKEINIITHNISVIEEEVLKCLADIKTSSNYANNAIEKINQANIELGNLNTAIKEYKILIQSEIGKTEENALFLAEKVPEDLQSLIINTLAETKTQTLPPRFRSR